MANPQNQTKILIIHTAFLGDIILATPFMRGLRKLFPKAEIHFLTTKIGAEILAYNPWDIQLKIFNKHGKDKGLGATLAQAKILQKEAYDFVFCLHRSFRSGFLAWRSGAPIRIGFAQTPAAFFLTKTFRRDPALLEGQKNLVLLNQLANRVVESSFIPEVRWSEADALVANALQAANEKYIVLAPCSVWNTKRWPEERFAELAKMFWEKYKWKTVLVGANSEKDLAICQKIISLLPEDFSNSIKNLCGTTKLTQLAVILKNAQIVVANDSAPLHLAVAVGAKGVAIFGPTTKSLGFFPHADKNSWSVVENNGLDCRPCGKHGHEQCPKEHFRCMLEIQPEQVWEEVKKICR